MKCRQKSRDYRYGDVLSSVSMLILSYQQCHTACAMMRHFYLQNLKQQYTAELVSIQQQQVAAQQALRQRFKRLTGDRAASLGGSSSDLGASGKSTLSELDTAQPAAAPAPTPIDSTPAQAVPTEQSSFYTARPAVPYSSGTQGVAADTAQPTMPHISYAGQSAMSNQPLSASWGAAPLQTTALDAPLTAQPSMSPPSISQSSRHAELEPAPTAQQQPDFAQSHYSASPLQHEGGSSHVTASYPALGESNHKLDADKYSPEAGGQMYQEPVAQSATESASHTADGDRARTEDVYTHPTSRDMAPVPTEADQSMSRNLPDLSKPPRPAASSARQQGLPKTGNVGQQPSGVGMLHDRSGMLGIFAAAACCLAHQSQQLLCYHVPRCYRDAFLMWQHF